MKISKNVEDILMKNLKNAGVTKNKLSKMLNRRIVGVRLETARGKMQIVASNAALGLTKKLSSDNEDFKKQSIKNGYFMMFNEKTVKSFDHLFANIRQAMLRYSIAKEGTTYYMTTENYEKFKELFNANYKNSFEEAKNLLISNLNIHKKVFSESLKKWLEEVVADKTERELLYNSYISKFPSKEEIERSCYMTLLLSSYPIVEKKQLKEVNADIAKEILESSVMADMETLYNMTYANLAECYKITDKVIKAIAEAESPEFTLNVSSRAKGQINQMIEYIENNNSILMNEVINYIVSLIKRSFLCYEDKEGNLINNLEASTVADGILAIIYNHCKELDMLEMLAELIKDNYTLEDLETISEVLDLENL